MAPPPAFFMEKDLHPVDYGCIGKFTLFLPMLRRLPANCSSCGRRSHSSGCAFGSPPGLTIPRVSGENSYTPSLCGPVAQLGARFHGMEEVVGSIRPGPPTFQPLTDIALFGLGAFGHKFTIILSDFPRFGFCRSSLLI